MNKVLFWLLQITWGAIMNVIGLIAFLVLVISGHKPRRFHQMVYFIVGSNWGGINLGFCTIISRASGESTLRHEHGHFIQNALFGPLFLVLVAIPSFTRSQYRNWLVRTKRKTRKELPDYYSIWFEGQATDFGYKYLKEV